MSGHRPFSDLIRTLPKNRQQRIAAQTEQLQVALTLAELRKHRQLSQAELARRLDVGQPAVARLEQRADPHLSRLKSYIEALGGHLEITARFDDESVPLLEQPTR